MPVNIEWDNEAKTIIRMELVGNWTWDEAYRGAQQGYAMLETVDHEVGVLMDLRNSKAIPSNAITHARIMIKQRHPRTGLTVFVGTTTFFTALWNVFSRLYTLLARQQNSVFAPTMEDARRMLSAKYGVSEDKIAS